MTFKLTYEPTPPEPETVTGTTAGTVSYSYLIPNEDKQDKPGKVTLHLSEGEYATDVYEPIEYKVGDKLYASEDSKLTNIPQSNQVGIVTKAPSAGNPFLNFYLKTQPSRIKPDGKIITGWTNEEIVEYKGQMK